MRRFLAPFSLIAAGLSALVFCGCAGQGPVGSATSAKAAVEQLPAHAPRDLLIFVPQSDDQAAQWLTFLNEHPRLRIVIGLSPRFQHFAKDAALRARLQELEKVGRVSLALQLPNPPILPLLLDTDSARASLPAGSPLPNPPFAHPEDVVQLVARAKSDYFRSWRSLPHGLILPYGAASANLFSLFDRLGFSWMAAALSAPGFDGAYRTGSFTVWDSTPLPRAVGTTVHLWDERQMKDSGMHVLKAWARELETNGHDMILPGDAGIAEMPLPPETAWARRSWLTRDWSAWIGTARKNAAWEGLRKTRQALEVYKNSGRASVQRLDMAFEEVYTAESASFFGAIGNDGMAASVSEEREHEFQATLSGVFRLLGDAPPDDLFETTAVSNAGQRASSTTITAEVLPSGLDHVVIEDAPGDDRGDGRLIPPPALPPGTFDLRRIDVSVSTEAVVWTVSLGAAGATMNGAMIDLYVDLNGQPGVGTVVFLQGRAMTAAARDAWEYAITITQDQARLYRTHGGDDFELTDTYPVVQQGSAVQVTIPRSLMRGSPRRWGYQALVMAVDSKSSRESPLPLALSADPKTPPIFDMLDPLDVNQTQLLQDLSSGRRNDVPFIRTGK